MRPGRLITFFGSEAPRILGMYRELRQSQRALGAMQVDMEALRGERDALRESHGEEVKEMRRRVQESAATTLGLQDRLTELRTSCEELENRIDSGAKRFVLGLQSAFATDVDSVGEVEQQIAKKRSDMSAVRRQLNQQETRLRNHREHLLRIAGPLESLTFAVDFLEERRALEAQLQEDLRRTLLAAVRETVRHASLLMLRRKARQLRRLGAPEGVLAEMLELREADLEATALQPFICSGGGGIEELPKLAVAERVADGFRAMEGSIRGRVKVRGTGICRVKRRRTNSNGHSRTYYARVEVSFAGSVQAEGRARTQTWMPAPLLAGLRQTARDAYRCGRQQAIAGSLSPRVENLEERCRALSHTLLTTLEAALPGGTSA